MDYANLYPPSDRIDSKERRGEVSPKNVMAVLTGTNTTSLPHRYCQLKQWLSSVVCCLVATYIHVSSELHGNTAHMGITSPILHIKKLKFTQVTACDLTFKQQNRSFNMIALRACCVLLFYPDLNGRMMSTHVLELRGSKGRRYAYV